MTTPDYPLLVVPGSETYQLAHIATYIASALSRHRYAPRGRAGREARADAVRDLAGGAAALDNATGATTPTTAENLPRPIDAATFNTARGLLTDGTRRADIVSLSAAGGRGWAVIGQVPGVGPVGAQVATPELAGAIRQHILTEPAAALAAWAVTGSQVQVPRVPDRVDLAAFVEHLNPADPQSQAVARHLRGFDRRTDAAIRGRFAGIDLDAAVADPGTVATPDESPAVGAEQSHVGQETPPGRAAASEAPAPGSQKAVSTASLPRTAARAASDAASAATPTRARSARATTSGSGQAKPRRAATRSATALHHVGPQPAPTTAPSAPATNAGP